MGLKDFLSGPKINNHTEDRIQVSFSHYGPTLGFSGTLTGTKRAICVERISLEMTGSDNMTSAFSWLAFRPLHASSEELVGDYSSAPTKFIISPGNIHHYNILFADNDAFADMKNHLETLSRNWQMFEGAGDPDQKFSAFSDNMITQQCLKTLQNIFYWKAGTYRVAISIHIRERDQPIQAIKSFVLTPDDISQLNRNIAEILKTCCSRPNTQYSTVLAPLTATKT